MSTWYRVNIHSNQIMPVEVIKETDKFVTILSKNPDSKYQPRCAKGGEFYPTFAGARAFLMERLAKRMTSLELQIAQARIDMGKVFMLEDTK